MLTIKNATFKYQDKPALSEVNLQILPNEIVGIVGESGSGKSTLAELMVGTITLDKGKIKNEFKSTLPIYQHASSSFNPKFTIQASLEEPLKYYHNGPKTNKWKSIHHYMQMMNLSPTLLSKKPEQLSGGQLQRFNIIRTLFLEPELLICDEITSNLDVITERKVIQILQQYHQQYEHSIVLISHDIAVLHQIIDRYIVIKNGQIIDNFAHQSLFSKERSPYTKELLSIYDY